MSAQPPDPSLKPTLPGMLRGQLSSYVARREPRVGGLLFVPPPPSARRSALLASGRSRPAAVERGRNAVAGKVRPS